MSDATQVVLEKADLEAMLVKATENLETAIAGANEEAKNAGSVANETRDKINALAEKASEITDRLTELEQRGLDVPNGNVNESIGTQFIKSDGYQAMRNGTAARARMEVKTAIINATGQNQPLVPDDRVSFVQTTPNRVLTIRDLLPSGRTSSNLIQFPREGTYTNNAGPQVSGSPEAFENVTKPESAITFSLVNEAVTTLAHFIPVSKQILDDAPALEGFINARLLYGLKLKEETQLLSGTGSNGQLNGLITQATSYTLQSPNLTNEFDIVRDAIKQAHVAEYRPNFLVLNPSDWYDMEVRKVSSSDDRYVFGDPANMAAPRVWGLPVVVTNSISSGTFLLGDSNGAMIFDREDAMVEASFEDSTNFQKNMCTIRAEERLALAVWRTEAFITGSL